MKTKTTLITLFICLFAFGSSRAQCNTSSSPNLVVNGDFNNGNTGFTTALIYTPVTVIPSPDHYYISNDAYPINPPNKWAAKSPDLSDFMIIDGSNSNNTLIWSQQINGIMPGASYEFSMLVTELNIDHWWGQGSLNIIITDQSGNTLLSQNTGLVVPKNSQSPPVYIWDPYTYGFNSLPSSTSLTLSITQGVGGSIGYDFGIENISLKECYTCIPPEIELTPNSTLCSGDSLQLVALAGGATGFTWSPSAGLNNSTISSPKASPSVTTTYTVTVTGTGGCTASATVTITVLPPSCTTGINEKGNKDFYISPNPTSGTFTVSFNESMLNASLKIFNMLGEEVYETAADKRGIASPATQTGASFAMTINLGRVPAGIYFVQVTDFGSAQSKDGVRQWVQKVVVE